jgi:hypothetical protein
MNPSSEFIHFIHNFKSTEFEDNSSEAQMSLYQNTLLFSTINKQYNNRQKNPRFGNPVQKGPRPNILSQNKHQHTTKLQRRK